MTVRILIGDVREKLAELPADSVHCVVTSPPYWGLRDYGVAGQLGMEPTLGEHIETMVEVFREVRRVLRPDGTVWLNYGDCYATAPNGRSAADTKAAGNDDRTFRDKPFSTVQGTLKPKDLCMVPNRLAIALQDDGWWVRSEIVWGKPNGMPDSSGRFRPATAHEKVFLLSKTGKMFYDAAAVKIPAAAETGPRLARKKREIIRDGEDPADVGALVVSGGGYAPPGQPPHQGARSDRKRGVGPRHAHLDTNHQTLTEHPRGEGRLLRNYEPDLSAIIPPEVWHIAIAGYSEAHFATFPPALVVPCILAGTSERGCCPECSAPWAREIKTTLVPTAKAAKTFVVDERDTRADRNDQGANRQKDGHKPGWINETETLGWSPSCKCRQLVDGPPGWVECAQEIPHSPIPCTVLDPFGGAGTTGMVADRLGRDAILIELNPEYAEMARRRIDDDAGMFSTVEAAE